MERSASVSVSASRLEIGEAPSWTGASHGNAERARSNALGVVARFLRQRWFSLDHRTLGLFRIAFGLCLLGNLYDHAAGGNLVAFFTNDGVLPNHLALFAPIQQRPWSLLFAFSSPAEVTVAFGAIAVVYLLYLVGWKTRVMQLLVIVCFVSIVNRDLLLQDGGSFTCTLLAVWTAFLPVGASFSVDSWLLRARKRAAPPAHVSVVSFVLLAQLALIYGFNAANKTGQTWHTGTAVHYILWLLSRNTALAGFLRLHEPTWFSPFLTRATLVFEWSAPLLALSPIFQTTCRRLLIAGMWSLHLGIASLMSLGPFSYAMLAFSVLLLRPTDWKDLSALTVRLRQKVRLDGIAGPPSSAVSSAAPLRTPSAGRLIAVTLREGVALMLFIAMLAEVTLANPVVPDRLRWASRPPWMAETLNYLRVYQTWGMFSPDAPASDGGIVIDALLADGSRVDPLTGRRPDFEAPLHGPYGLDHDWSEYMFYYSWERHRTFRGGLRDYAIRRHDAASDSAREKRILSLDIYMVTADSPPPGEVTPRNLKRELMLSYTAEP